VIAYQVGGAHPTVFVAADDGGGARALGTGRVPRVSPDGSVVVYEQARVRSPRLVVHSLATGTARTVPVRPADGSDLDTFSRDGRLMLAQRDRRLMLLDLAAGQVTGRWETAGPGSAVLSPDGRRIAAVTTTRQGRRLTVIDIADGTRHRHALNRKLLALAWTPAGITGALLTRSALRAALVDAATGSVERLGGMPRGKQTVIAGYSVDGRLRLAAWDWDGGHELAMLLDPATGRLDRYRLPPGLSLEAFQADQRHLLVRRDTRLLRLDRVTGVRTVIADRVLAVDASLLPDGTPIPAAP
jgi:hypothetical protein